jgi:hypothetical protein
LDEAAEALMDDKLTIEEPRAKILCEAEDWGQPGGQVVLGYDNDGSLYIEVYHRGVGRMRATFAANEKYLCRFLREAHEKAPP